MELPALSVLQAAIVVQPVGDGAVLLCLQDQSVRLDCMHCAGIDLDKITLADGNLADQLLPFSPVHHVVQLFFCPGIVSDDQSCILLTIHDIPALCLTQAAVLMLLCIGIVRMHLDAQIVLGIDNFGQQRIPVITQVPKQFRVLLPYLGQLTALIIPLAHGPVPFRVGGNPPALSQVIPLHGVTEYFPQLGTAPDIVGAYRIQEQQFSAFSAHIISSAYIHISREKP